MTKKKTFLDVVSTNRFIHTLLAIILGFLFGAIFLAIMGLSVGQAYGRLINSVTTLKGFSYVIVYSIPYIMTGLSVAFSFKTGVFNIGNAFSAKKALSSVSFSLSLTMRQGIRFFAKIHANA